MFCTKEIDKCPICNKNLEPLPTLAWVIAGIKGFYCEDCKIVYKELPLCDGEIKKVWKEGKLYGCVCGKCGKSYGKNFLTRIKFLESFIGV